MEVTETQAVEKNNTDVVKGEEKSDKADSGMDEDSQPYQGLEDEDDEDEVIIRRPKLKKAIFDDEDDDSNLTGEEKDRDVSNAVSTSLKTADQVLDAVMNVDTHSEVNSDSSEDEENETLLSTLKKKKKIIKRRNIDSDSDEDTDKQEINHTITEAQTQTKSIFGNSDLFDAEEDNDTTDRNSGDETASESNKEEDDEGFDETSIDPKLLKKLKQGASKKASKPKKKVEQEEKLELHSETQRLIRESRVNLPYHQPEPKRLQDFLARATNKQQQYRALRGARDSKKVQVMEEILSKTKLTSKNEDIDQQHNKSNVYLDNDKDTSQCVSSQQSDQLVLSDCGLQQSDNKQLSNCEQQSVENIDGDDCDSLPDITDHVTEDSDHVTSVKMDVEETDSAKIYTDSINNQDNDKSKSAETVSIETSCAEEDSENKENRCSESEVETITPSNTLNKKLAVLSELPSLPKLSGGPDNFIDLEVDNSPSQKPGYSKLMDRFMEHSKKKHKHATKDVEVSIVQKEKTDTDKEELKLNTFVYHVSEAEDSMSQFDAPGAKLVALKDKLQQKMKVKREEHRKQRQEIFDLDNEEGYGEDEEDKVLDNDDEMTDQSDTDVEDEDFDEEFGEEEYGDEEDRNIKNPFCDDEAEEDDDDDEMGLRLHLSDEEDDDDKELRLHLSDDVNTDNDGDNENEEEDDVPRKPSSLKKKPKVLAISDDEESQQSAKDSIKTGTVTVNTCNSHEKKLDDSIEEEAFTPFSKHISRMDSTQQPSNKKGLSLPIEDSQDLYGKNNTSQENNFYIEESQMLDADGFLKFGSDRKPQQPISKSPNFENLIPTQDGGDMDELLGLCSGRFVDEDKKTSCKNLFGLHTQSAPDNTQGNMEELLGLCSGKFVSNTQPTQTKPGKKRKADFDEDSNTSLQMVSDAEEEDFVVKDENTFSDDEEVDPDSNSVQSEDKIQPFTGFVSRKSGKIRKEFVDEEAELSGSEYDSDENVDLALEDDIMEAELGDADVTATEEELRDQVGRAHLKQIIDDDKRELMRFQEMYLPDGDLHSDGGRTRRFKWSNIDDDTQQDMFDDKSDEEKEEEDGEEAKWRKDRFEREKWLQEQQDSEKMEDEDSQFLKLGKVFLKRRDSDSSLLKKPEAAKTGKQLTGLPATKLSIPRRGSFLGRDKDALAKIANITKTSVNPSGARNSGKFVFQVISPDKDSQAMPAPAEPKVKKSLSKQPPSKKPRLERSASFSQNSIFNHL